MYELERATNDEERCQVAAGMGRCPNKIVPGTKNCPMHGGIAAARGIENRELRNYRLTKWRETIAEKANSPALKTMTEEIGIARMMLENLLEQCTSPTDLMIHQAVIGQQVQVIERVVTACHKIDKDMAGLIGRDELMKFADEVVRIVSDAVPPQMLPEVSEQLTLAVTNITAKRG